MFKKLDSKKLSVVFIVLLILVLIVTLLDRKQGDRTIIENLVETDTADVNKIVILSSNSGEEISIEKIDNAWKLNHNGKYLDTDPNKMKNVLDMLTRLKPSTMVADEKEKWNEYNVTDSAGVNLMVYKGKKKVADLIIGKMDYKPKQSQYGNYGGNQQSMGDFKTFVRQRKEKKVYAVNEFLSMTFSSDLNSYRNHTVLKLNKGDIRKITFTYPADSSIVLSENNGKWFVNEIAADSAGVQQYLTSLSGVSAYAFAEHELTGNPVIKMMIEGDNMVQPIVLKVFNEDGVNYLHSSLNADAYFNADESGLMGRVFAGKEKFLENKE